MNKYVFTPDIKIAEINGKTQADIDNLLNVAILRYGTIEEYIEPTAVIEDTAIMELKKDFENTNLSLSEAKAELEKYAPLIKAFKDINSENILEIQNVKAELEIGKIAERKIIEIRDKLIEIQNII